MDCLANREPLTPLAVLERSLASFPDKTAVIYGPETWSYRRFGEEISRLAGALTRAGVEPDDRVALVAPNVPTLLVAHFAVLQVRATLVAINPQLSSEVIAGIVNHSGAKIVFVDPEFAPLFLDAALEHQPVLVNLEDPVAGVLGRPLDGPTYDDFVQEVPLTPR
jgi:fatty-acyl-CoA synthase